MSNDLAGALVLGVAIGITFAGAFVCGAYCMFQQLRKAQRAGFRIQDWRYGKDV